MRACGEPRYVRAIYAVHVFIIALLGIITSLLRFLGFDILRLNMHSTRIVKDTKNIHRAIFTVDAHSRYSRYDILSAIDIIIY